MVQSPIDEFMIRRIAAADGGTGTLYVFPARRNIDSSISEGTID